jgi:GH15 family glucan-1,4-alpha-glucosidase
VPLPIEDYAVVGDTRTAALVGRDGSVDWLCLPRFDSSACFAALLGGPEHGRWLLAPAADARCERRYVGDSAVLESTYTTPSGVVRVVDAMPLGDGRADLVRRVEGVEGKVTMRLEWVVRFGYGRIRPWVRRRDDRGQEVLTAVAGPDLLLLRGPRLPKASDGRHVDEIEVAEGETLTYSLTWQPSHQRLARCLDTEASLAETPRRWERWAGRCRYDGPYRDEVVRSLLTLRLLTHQETGGIVAAPTTSLPEEPGGERNWDYRYCWLRDAALTLTALLRCGYSEEARGWRDWLLRAVAGDPEDMQVMYTLDGSRELPERTLRHLPGYEGARPVRVGNGAVRQRQTDVLGEVMSALALGRRHGLPGDENAWAVQHALVDDLDRHWRRRDHGLWEIRGRPRHFTHSRVMVWTAFDRAVRAVETEGLPGPVDRWRRTRDRVRAEILAKGLDRERGTFTQHYETREVDASLLVLPTTGFVDGSDPLMLGTIAAVEDDLGSDGMLLRYRNQTGVDGIDCDEGAFVACSFWLVSAYAAAGLLDRADALMDRLVGLVNDVGLLAEEYHPDTGHFAGNHPQAFSHLSLVGAALDLAEAHGR